MWIQGQAAAAAAALFSQCDASQLNATRKNRTGDPVEASVGWWYKTKVAPWLHLYHGQWQSTDDKPGQNLKYDHSCFISIPLPFSLLLRRLETVLPLQRVKQVTTRGQAATTNWLLATTTNTATTSPRQHLPQPMCKGRCVKLEP